MKILHITKKYANLIGGDAIVVKNLIAQQEQNNIETVILTSNNDAIITKDRVHKFGLKLSNAELDTINYKRILSLLILLFYSFVLFKKIKPSLIHSHSVDMGFIVSFACRFYGISHITTFHNGLFSIKNPRSFRGIMEYLFIHSSGFKKIITVNKQDVKKFTGQKLLHIPNGVDLETFTPIRKKPHYEKKVLFVGRIVKDKGLDYLLTALKVLQKDTPKITLTIVGEGSYEKKLKEKIKKENITNVHFLKNMPHAKLSMQYAKADVFVLPSTNQEGFGLVLIEALASGAPVIATDICGLSKYIKEYKAGIIIPQKNAELLARAIAQVLTDPKKASLFAKNGRQLVAEKFSWQKIAQDTNRLYEKFSPTQAQNHLYKVAAIDK